MTHNPFNQLRSLIVICFNVLPVLLFVPSDLEFSKTFVSVCVCRPLVVELYATTYIDIMREIQTRTMRSRRYGSCTQENEFILN